MSDFAFLSIMIDKILTCSLMDMANRLHNKKLALLCLPLKRKQTKILSIIKANISTVRRNCSSWDAWIKKILLRRERMIREK